MSLLIDRICSKFRFVNYLEKSNFRWNEMKSEFVSVRGRCDHVIHALVMIPSAARVFYSAFHPYMCFIGKTDMPRMILCRMIYRRRTFLATYDTSNKHTDSRTWNWLAYAFFQGIGSSIQFQFSSSIYKRNHNHSEKKKKQFPLFFILHIEFYCYYYHCTRIIFKWVALSFEAHTRDSTSTHYLSFNFIALCDEASRTALSCCLLKLKVGILFQIIAIKVLFANRRVCDTCKYNWLNMNYDFNDMRCITMLVARHESFWLYSNNIC